MKPLKVQIVEMQNGEHYFRFKSSNGQILNHRYNHKGDCERAIKRLVEELQSGNYVFEYAAETVEIEAAEEAPFYEAPETRDTPESEEITGNTVEQSECEGK